MRGTILVMVWYSWHALPILAPKAPLLNKLEQYVLRERRHSSSGLQATQRTAIARARDVRTYLTEAASTV